MNESAPKEKQRANMPVWVVVTVAITFAIGVTSGVLLKNILTQNNVSMSTASVISFVFTVALGGASLVLAVITVFLSKHAEETLVRRSDEGIKLQNDAFIKTSEVLTKIESSTGVTEKRIEDIIAGRTGVIAQEVIDRSLSKDKPPLTQRELRKLREELSESIRQEMLPLLASPISVGQRLSALSQKQERNQAIRARFRKYKHELAAELEKLATVKEVTVGEGQPSGESATNFWDLMATVKGKRVGIVAFLGDHFLDPEGALNHWLAEPSSWTAFSRNVVWRCLEDDLAAVAIISDVKLDEIEGLPVDFGKIAKAINPRMLLSLTGSAKQVASELTERLR